MLFQRCLLARAMAALLFAATPLAWAADDTPAATPTVKVLFVAKDTSSPLGVNAPSFVQVDQWTLGAIFSARVGETHRRQSLAWTLENILESRFPQFDLVDSGFTIPHTLDADASQQTMSAQIAGARDRGIPYVLAFDEESLVLFGDGTRHRTPVIPRWIGRAMLFSTHDGAEVFNTRLIVEGHRWGGLPDAAYDPQFLTRQLPAMSGLMADEVVHALYTSDALHGMAASAGRGAEVPAMAPTLQALSSRVEQRWGRAKGWRNIPGQPGLLPPIVATGKRPIGSTIRLRAQVDLLLPQLTRGALAGDASATYEQQLLDRAAQRGMNPTSAQELTGLTKPGYRIIVLRNLIGSGGSIIAYRQIDDTYGSAIIFEAATLLDNALREHLPLLQRALDAVTVTIAGDGDASQR